MNATIDADIMKRLQIAVDNAAKGIRDPELVRQACEEMDAAREELRQRIGTVDLAVELVRDARQ